MSTNKPPFDPRTMTVMYGGAPEPWYPRPQPLPPSPWVGPATDTADTPVVAPAPQKVTVAARITADGKLQIRITVDGVHVSETETDGKHLTVTEEI